MAAAANGHVNIVRALLAAGAPWNAFDRQANCAGDYALLNNRQECVEALINAGTITLSGFIEPANAVMLLDVTCRQDFFKELC